MSLIKKPYYYHAHVVSVYDGDTLRANVDLGLEVYNNDQIFRLAGIDTPELRTDDEEEKERAYQARDWVRDKILDKDIVIQTFKDVKGSWRRYLANIYEVTEEGRFDPENSINDQLLELGLADKEV